MIELSDLEKMQLLMRKDIDGGAYNRFVVPFSGIGGTDGYVLPQTQPVAPVAPASESLPWIDTWSDRALALFKEFIQKNPDPFTIEDFKRWCMFYIEEPTHKNCWVGLLQRVSHLIERTGEFRRSSDPKARGRKLAIWRLQ